MSFRSRQHPRRQPGLHRPAPVAPDTPAEVLERAPDVPRETWGIGKGSPLEADLEPSIPAAPPLRKEQVARLEAATAVWTREVREAGGWQPGPEDTLLYAAPKPPPPPRRDELPPVIEKKLEPEENTATPTPDPDPDPVRDGDPGSARVIRDWVSRHDDRSRNFDVAAKLRARVSMQDRDWMTGPIFDQGTTPPLSLHDASGCVGMATAAAANVLGIAASKFAQWSAFDLLTKEDALKLYARAQQLDHLSGESYAGTSVLAGMKAGQEAGLWSGYLWAFGTRDIAQAILQVGPVVVGIPWLTGMEDPDADGVIAPTGSPAGGHCMALVGLRMKVAGRPGPYFVAQQSRGESVGAHGLVLIHHKDLTKLLAGRGEAAIPVPPGGLP